MNATTNNRNNRSILALFRRSERWREIPPGYHVGDVRSDIPIALLPGARVLGNIFAPKILVEGMLYGSAVALEITIEADGQIWGDVYSGRLQVEPGGRLQGWVSHLDVSDYEDLLGEGLIPEEVQDHTIELTELPGEAVESGLLVRGESQLNVLRRLQMEAAAALAARDELEREFEKRLNETAGEATARAASLHEELSRLRLELTNLREDRDEVREELRERSAQVERQANEIITARQLLTERTEQYETLQQEHATKLEELTNLIQAKNMLENDLLAANKQIDTLSDRIHSIESALQNSLQHASEQEESLIRWQELAEVNESKGQGLQGEIENLKFQVAESSRLNEMLRAQRKHAEEAWEAATQELENLRRKEARQTVPLQVVEEMEKEMGQLKESLSEVEEQHTKQTDKLNQLQAEYEAQLAPLRQEAAKAKQEMQRMQELMLWDKATLENTQKSLAKAQAALEEKEADYSRWQGEWNSQKSAFQEMKKRLATQTAKEQELLAQTQAKEDALLEMQSMVAAQETEFGRLQTAVQERETAVAELRQEMAQFAEEAAASETQLSQIQEQSVLRTSELETRLRETRLQLEAQEAETENYFQQMERQGQRLAEMQAALIERMLEMKQLQETADKQKVLISRMKEVTTERMDKLNGELAQTREQLKQAIAVVKKLRTQ